jgi:hypothetical protein
VVCSRASSSATDWPPDGGASISESGSVPRWRALGDGGGDITGALSGGAGGDGGVGGGGGDIAGAGVADSSMPGSE